MLHQRAPSPGNSPPRPIARPVLTKRKIVDVSNDAKPPATPGFVKHYRKYVASVYDAVDVDDALHKLAQEPFYNNRETSPPQDVRNSVMALFWPVWELYWEFYWELH
jgi:hypothetical protein